VSCDSTRRILTPFHFFHQLRDTTAANSHEVLERVRQKW
jgi:hypothetical protein